MSRKLLLTVIMLGFLCGVVYGEEKKGKPEDIRRNTTAKEDVEFLLSIQSGFVTKEIKEKKREIINRVINKPMEYIPILKEITRLDNLKKGKQSWSDSRRLTSGLSYLGCIDNKEARGILKQKYLELAKWETHIKTSRKKDWYKKSHDVRSVRAHILRIFSLYNNPSLWDECVEELEQWKGGDLGITGNIIQYFKDTYQSVDGKTLSSTVDTIKEVFTKHRMMSVPWVKLSIDLFNKRLKELVRVGKPDKKPEPVYNGKKLSEWIEQLEDKDVAKRCEAAEALGEAKDKSVVVLPINSVGYIE